jgi:uncharacterized membrane protein
MRVAAAIVHALLVALYPLAVYIGLTRGSTRTVALLLLGAITLIALLRVRGQSREHLWVLLRVPLSIAAVLVLASITDDARLVLALPVVVSAVLLWHFGTSLRGMPLVERFARMQRGTLSEAQVRYCRTVTKVWCVFFVFNGAVAGALALWAPVAWWALYTGIVAYVLIGVVGGTEYVVRKYRFREYGGGLHDRLLARLMPPPDAPKSPKDPKAHTDRWTLPRTRVSDTQDRVAVDGALGYFEGHFPGLPLLPGIVQLTGLVLPAVHARWPDLTEPTGLRGVKFRHPLRPGDTVDVSVTREGRQVRFELVSGGQPAASGKLLFGADEAAP